MKSLRSKFSIVIVFILVTALSASGIYLIYENVSVLTNKLQQDAINYSEFASVSIADSYETQYKTGSFVLFSQFIGRSLQRNTDISKIRIISKENGILYDSLVEKDKAYQGPSREIQDTQVRTRLLDVKPSFELKSSEIVYLLKNSSGIYEAVDQNGSKISEGIEGRVKNLVYPLPDRSYGFVYDISYINIDNNIISTVIRMSLLLLGSCFIAILIALFFVGKIVKPVEKLKKGAEKIAQGDFDTRVEVKTKDEIGVLADTFNAMAADLKKSTKELLEKERLDHEINLAAEIQNDFIPKQIPEIKGLDIAASVVPATEVGGDCYDFIKKGDDLLVFIADVTGHGVSAGLVEAITNSLVLAFSYIHESTKDSIVDMNFIIHKKTRPNVFVTSIMGMWHTNNSCFKYANAGHDPIIHYKASERKALLLNKGGLALGMISDIKELVKEEEVCLESGDLLVMYTDGIPEAWNNAKEQFGMEKLITLIEQHAHLPSAQNIHDGLIQGVRMHMGDFDQADDITLIVMKKM